MSSETFVVTRPDGVALFAKKWLPAGETHGVVQLVTGMAEFLERYEHVAQALNDAGYAVYGHDHRCQGNTARSQDEMGKLGRGDWQRLVDDMRALHDICVQQQPELPQFMYAHSMGSFLAQTYLYTHPGTKRGVILQGSESGRFWFWPVMLPVSRLGRKFRGGDTASRFVPKLQSILFNIKYKPKRTEFDWLNTDASVVDAYMSDPRCGWTASHGFWLEMSKGMLANGRAENLKRIPAETRLFLTCGSMDPTADYGNALSRLEKQYRDAGLSQIETKQYEGMRHEIHNEPARQEVFRDLIQWMDRQRGGQNTTQAAS